VRQATEAGDDCMQLPVDDPVAPPGTSPSENCLALNVWRLADASADPLPVIVWVHGGFYVNGGSSTELFDGSAARATGTGATTDNDRQMAQWFSGYVAEFVRTGDPNGARLPAWPKFHPASFDLMHFTLNDGPVVEPDPRAARVALVERAADALAAGVPALEVPGTCAGTLPCASCPGIEWTLTLLEDGSYRLRRVYLEAEDAEDRGFVELGRWDTGRPDDRLVLRGRRDGPIQFEIADTHTLRLLSQQGQPIESQLDYALKRLAQVDRISDVFPMQGQFTYMADAGRFSECRTGTSLPVAQEADNAALERAYAEARQEPGAPVLVTFDGRFAMRPPMEGDGLREVVIVEKFGEVRPGERCEGRPR
jgi:uncharacterized lipoprotein NlpE involved in copper resistance